MGGNVSRVSQKLHQLTEMGQSYYLILISDLLLLKQINLLKTKITQCQVSLAVQSQLSRSESPYRADVIQFSYFAGNSFDSVPFLCSNLLWCGFSIPGVGYFKLSIRKGSSGPPSKACLTNGLRPMKMTHFHRAHFPVDSCLSHLTFGWNIH